MESTIHITEEPGDWIEPAQRCKWSRLLAVADWHGLLLASTVAPDWSWEADWQSPPWRRLPRCLIGDRFYVSDPLDRQRDQDDV